MKIFQPIVTGSLTTSGSVFLKGLTSAAQSNVILIDTASGQLYTTSSSALGGGGSGTTSPGGLTTQIQYNNAGVFGGVPDLTWDGTTLRATGSFNGSFSGSFTGSISNAVSASYALTASYSLNAQSASSTLQAVSSSYSLTSSYALNAGTSIDTGSFATTSSFNSFTSSYSTGSFTGSFTGELFGTASYAVSALTASYVIGGGSTFPYTGTAVITGSLVVTSTLQLDGTLTDYATVNSTIVGSNNLYTQSTGSYTATFVKYTVSKGTNSRAGEFIVNWNGALPVEYTDVSTTDIGSTSDVVFSSAIGSSQIQVNATTATSGWKIKTLATFI